MAMCCLERSNEYEKDDNHNGEITRGETLQWLEVTG